MWQVKHNCRRFCLTEALLSAECAELRQVIYLDSMWATNCQKNFVAQKTDAQYRCAILYFVFCPHEDRAFISLYEKNSIFPRVFLCVFWPILSPPLPSPSRPETRLSSEHPLSLGHAPHYSCQGNFRSAATIQEKIWACTDRTLLTAILHHYKVGGLGGVIMSDVVIILGREDCLFSGHKQKQSRGCWLTAVQWALSDKRAQAH